MGEGLPIVSSNAASGAALPAHKDRRTALIVFGILVLLLGMALGLIELVLLSAPPGTPRARTAADSAPLLGSMGLMNIILHT